MKISKCEFMQTRMDKSLLKNIHFAHIAMLCIIFQGTGLVKDALAIEKIPQAQNTNLGGKLRELQSRVNKHQSFRVKFDQQVYSALRQKTNMSAGELLFAQPRKFRWEITKPSKEVYTNNGEWFWKYVESTKHAVRLPAQSSELQFLDLVFALDKLENNYQLQDLKQLTGIDGKEIRPCPAKHTCVGLVPQQKSGQKSIELAINDTNGFVSIIRIDFRNGNKTNIAFSSFQDEKVTENAFNFTPPPNTAIDKR